MDKENRFLKMRVAGRFIDLLGNQMYGGPVPSIAEFIANAWDADAEKVEVLLPEDVREEGAEVVVRDYGLGMTFEEIQDYYLQIGYEKRKLTGNRTSKGRLVMGRKGIGKLAGFGIAEIIEIRSIKNHRVTGFCLDYNKIKDLKHVEDYVIEVLEDQACDEESGVRITLKNLKLSRNIAVDSFIKSMAKRFAILGNRMKVWVNGQEVKSEDLIYENRVDWQEDTIPEVGKVNYWYGFLKNTIQDPELRGFTVFARERTAQMTPFHFNITGGFNGQMGLEYLTGQIKADFLDDLEEDLISTDRQSINWNHEMTQKFQEWGQRLIKKACQDWKKRKDERNIELFHHSYGEFYERIAALPVQEKQDVRLALDKIAKLDKIDKADFKVIANSLIAGIERESVKKIIQRINAADDGAAGELLDVINEWDIVSAVATAEVVAGKLSIIDQFRKLIDARTPEKSPNVPIDMQTFIKEHPWLLGPEYGHLAPADFHHEKGIDKWIKDVILNTDKEFIYQDKEKKRFDLVCIKNDFLVVVLELMRPGLPADYDHASRLVRYVTRIQQGIATNGTQPRYERMSVYGWLIADEVTKDQSLQEFCITNRKYMDITSWNGLFSIVYANYRDFFEILKQKAPEDPRIKGLISI